MWKKIFKLTPTNVANILVGIKSILVGIAGAEMIVGKADIAFYILLATGVLSEVANYIKDKKRK